MRSAEFGYFLKLTMRSAEFGYLVCFMSMHTYRQGFFLATLGPQVEAFFPDEATADFLQDLFNIALPLGFIPMLLCTVSGLTGFILPKPRLAFVAVTALSMLSNFATRGGV
ncbi:hypothetical protein T484DRAFT_1761952 [Baffinella frigidus]|nr:hypothetical protein T484DRAFT_1761952 [Cryptophyta sp. CCMP2293]